MMNPCENICVSWLYYICIELNLQNCPAICEIQYNCVECAGFNQGLYNQSICDQRCKNVEIVSLLQEACKYPGFFLNDKGKNQGGQIRFLLKYKDMNLATNYYLGGKI